MLLLSLGSLCGRGDASAAPAQITTIEPPPANGQPIAIKVGVYILNLVALDEVSQTFTCTGYLTQTWQDRRLAFSPSAGQPITRHYRKQDIWFPLLQFDNSAAPRTLSSYLLVGRADGTVDYVEKFAVRLSTNMHLRAFPFDSQELEIYIHPFTGQVSRIVLIVEPQSTGVSTAPYTPLPLWRTGRITYRSVRGDGTGYKVSSHVVFAIHVVRNSEYYIFWIFVPLALMVAVSWGVLWIPPDDLNSQLLISVTTLLTLVAFSVSLSNMLPPVAYLTFYDVFFLVCFLFILLTIGEALVVHTIQRKADRAALRIRRMTRRLLPPSFVVIALLLAYKFIRHCFLSIY